MFAKETKAVKKGPASQTHTASSSSRALTEKPQGKANVAAGAKRKMDETPAANKSAKGPQKPTPGSLTGSAAKQPLASVAADRALRAARAHERAFNAVVSAKLPTTPGKKGKAGGRMGGGASGPEVDELKASLTESSADNERLTCQIEKLQAARNRAETALKAREAELEAAAAEAEARAADVGAGKQAAEEEAAALRVDLEATQVALGEQAKKTAALEAALEARAAELEATAGARQAAETEAASLREMVAALEATVEARDAELAHLAERGRSQEELRRQMHETIQELKGNIRVFARVRPALEADVPTLMRTRAPRRPGRVPRSALTCLAEWAPPRLARVCASVNACAPMRLRVAPAPRSDWRHRADDTRGPASQRRGQGPAGRWPRPRQHQVQVRPVSARNVAVGCPATTPSASATRRPPRLGPAGAPDARPSAPRPPVPRRSVFAESASQEEVFTEVAHLTQSALDGFKVCIFAYGQTGSGKTHTMQGAGGEHRGIIPRAAEQVFGHAAELALLGWEFTFEASFLEIYNEEIRDVSPPRRRPRARNLPRRRPALGADLAGHGARHSCCRTSTQTRWRAARMPPRSCALSITATRCRFTGCARRR